VTPSLLECLRYYPMNSLRDMRYVLRDFIPTKTSIPPTPLQCRERVSLAWAFGRKLDALRQSRSLDDVNSWIHFERLLQEEDPEEDVGCVVARGSVYVDEVPVALERPLPVVIKIYYQAKANLALEHAGSAEQTLDTTEIFHATAALLTPCVAMVYGVLDVEGGACALRYADQGVITRVLGGGIHFWPCEEGEEIPALPGRIHMAIYEDCGDMSLARYFNTRGSGKQLHGIVAMIYHALAQFSTLRVSHNDLHSKNIIICRSPQSIVSLGEFTFQMKVVPKIIDWGLGRSDATPNALLEDENINSYGIFNAYNSLFDMIGFTKLLFWHHETSTAINCRARSVEFHDIIVSLKASFKPLMEQFPALFSFENGVQQTKFEVDGIIKETWPEEARARCPSFEGILQSLYKGACFDEKWKCTSHHFFPSVSGKEWRSRT
jgi:hypothetical protein